jgi:hypothetical protein
MFRRGGGLKRGFYIPELFLGAMLAVVVFALGAAVQLYEIGPRQAENQQTDQAPNQVAPPVSAEERLADYTFALVIFTGVLAASTIGLWGVTGFGVYRQAKDTRILQRAYIAVEPRGIRLLVEGKRVIGHVGMRNAGNLPAGKVAWFVDLKTSTNDLETVFPLGRPAGSIVVAPGVVAPRGTGESLNINDLDKAANSQSPANRASENPLFIYVWGVVRYDDGFGNERNTVFCHRYNWKSRGMGGVVDHTIHEDYARYHEHGNGAT